MSRRNLDQNALFHARIRDWATGFHAHYCGGKPTRKAIEKAADTLKAYIKVYAEINYGDMFPDLIVGGTHSLTVAQMSALVDIMEQFFGEKFPLAYTPLRRDKDWNTD
jgi:hypothetical protein